MLQQEDTDFLEQTLKNINDEDKIAIAELLGVKTPTEEDKTNTELNRKIELAFSLDDIKAVTGLNDGAMTARERKAYEETLRGNNKQEVDPSKNNPGKDDALILEWKMRNRERQRKELEQLLLKRKIKT